jgi:hypothetical protein
LGRASRPALQEALTQLELSGFSDKSEAVHVVTQEVDLRGTVIAGRDSGKVSVQLDISMNGLPISDLAGTGVVVASQSEPRSSPVRQVGVIDAAGLVVLHGIPPGRWEFDTVERAPDDIGSWVLPLPRFRREGFDLAASHGSYIVETPSGAVFMVHAPEVGGSYKLDVVGPRDFAKVLQITFTNVQGHRASILVPIASTGVGSPRSQAWMHGYAPNAPWWINDAVDPAMLTQDDRSLIEDSIGAAADKATQRAWRGLAEAAASPQVAEIIHARLRQ